MKAIISGATGFIGREVFEQCVQHPDITSIIVLTRRPLSTPAASHEKVKVLIMENFTSYSDSNFDEIKDADICIW
jgi:NAD dependent epimerase/dehydratase family enzyme